MTTEQDNMTASKLDPTKLADWQIAEASEKNMKTPQQLGAELGLLEEELIPMGRSLARVDYRRVLDRLGEDSGNAKYIDVTAITPTPLGEGKSTSTMGLIQGMGKMGDEVKIILNVDQLLFDEELAAIEAVA